MSYTLNKHQILEDLDSCSGIEQFLSTAVAEIIKAIDAKVEESTRNNDLATPNVLLVSADSLSGPYVKLKFLANLGVIPYSLYKDIIDLLILAKTVYSSGVLYDFNSPDIFYELKNLYIMKKLNFLQFEPIELEEGLDPRPRLRSIENQKRLIRKEVAIAIYSILFDFYRS